MRGMASGLEDPDYKGLELDMMVFFEKHGKASERLVAFVGTYTCRSEPMSDMKGEMAKKDVDLQHLNEKYQLLVNLTRAQGTVIQNRKLKHMKEKELLSEARMKVESRNVELTKCEENLTQDKLELKLQVADLLKEKEKHVEEKGQLKLQIAELMEGEDKLEQKIKGIQAILEK
ncbi:hypothetical protein ZWY2020_044011 [Hordeum vulgare]|nr:hypothetical protein ZWY2020_044011 [Hordeum vulgare]